MDQKRDINIKIKYCGKEDFTQSLTFSQCSGLVSGRFLSTSVKLTSVSKVSKLNWFLFFLLLSFLWVLVEATVIFSLFPLFIMSRLIVFLVTDSA